LLTSLMFRRMESLLFIPQHKNYKLVSHTSSNKSCFSLPPGQRHSTTTTTISELSMTSLFSWMWIPVDVSLTFTVDSSTFVEACVCDELCFIRLIVFMRAPAQREGRRVIWEGPKALHRSPAGFIIFV